MDVTEQRGYNYYVSMTIGRCDTEKGKGKLVCGELGRTSL
jgi:hypothetical protein